MPIQLTPTEESAYRAFLDLSGSLPQGTAMAVHVGNYAVLITKREWNDQPDDEARKALVQTRVQRALERPEGRGTGRTTAAMLAAPPDAIYVLPYRAMEHYTRALAAHLGRTDIMFKDMSWLRGENWLGMDVSRIVLDHAAYEMARRQDWEAIQMLRACQRARAARGGHVNSAD